MDTFIKAFLLSRQADGVSLTTLKWHKYSLQSFTRWIEGGMHPTHPDDWTPTLLREYVVSLQVSDLSGWTVTNKVQSLLAFTRWLHAEGYTDLNVGERIKKPKPPQSQRQPFTNAEVKQLLKAAQARPRDAAIVALLYDCALRANELCTLRLDDLVLSQNVVRVIGKGNKQRVVPYSAATGKLLTRWLLKERNSEGVYVFHTERSDCFNPRSLHKLIHRLGERAHVKDVFPHRFRHTAAISMLRNGCDPLTLSRILGHSSLTMTMRYLALNTDDLVRSHAQSSPLTHLLR